MNRRNNILIFLSLSVCLLGVGIIPYLPYFQINQQINVIDLLQILATLFIAYYISVILDKEKQDDRIERDLFIKHLGDIYKLIEESGEKAALGTISYQEAASNIKRINMSIDRIFKLLEEVKRTVTLNQNDILEHTRRLRDLLTNSPPNIAHKIVEESELPINVKDGLIHLAKSRIQEIEHEYDKLKHFILQLQLSINKA